MRRSCLRWIGRELEWSFRLELVAVLGRGDAYCAAKHLREVAESRMPNLQCDIDHAFRRLAKEFSALSLPSPVSLRWMGRRACADE